MIKRKEKNNKGFTLVELLTSLTVFVVVVTVASGIFISAIRAQRRALAYQELLDQTSYLMEYMSRAIRMAKKDFDGNCMGGDPNLNYKISSSGGIVFENYNGDCQEFYAQGGKLWELKASGSPVELTSDNLEVLTFNIGSDDSWDQDDNLQPRITLFLHIKRVGTTPEEQPDIEIQTTISQRKLDVIY
jgi:prepilin-type N-terminal cleavage/methylation domain-containing protein